MKALAPMRAEARNAQRKLLLDAAGRLLRKEGPDALSLRRIAGEVSASTTIAYTLFGGKEGVIAALREEGFERLAAAFDRVRAGGDAIALLRRYGIAYREFALAEPEWFAVMSGRALPGADEAVAKGVRSSRAYRRFRDQVTACIEEGVFPKGRAEDIADGLWGVAHGLSSLELAGYFPDAKTAKHRFERALDAVAHGYAAG